MRTPCEHESLRFWDRSGACNSLTGLKHFWEQRKDRILLSQALKKDSVLFRFASQVIYDLIEESSSQEAALAGDPHQNGYTLHKQIHLCSDSIHLLLLKPWDFICRLRVGPTFERQVMNLKCFQKIPYSTDSLLSRIIRCSNVKFGAELVEFILYRPDQSYYEFGQTSECRCRGDTCLMIQNFDKAKSKLDQRRESYKMKSDADARPEYSRRRVSAPNIAVTPAQKVRRPSLISNGMAPLKQLLSVQNLPARCPTRADPNERDEFGVTPLMLLVIQLSSISHQNLK